MLCPVDGETLVMTDRNGVEIDYCPKCRGVWLDRGELDKIIDRSAPPVAAAEPRRAAEPAPAYQREPAPSQYARRHHDDDHDDDHRYRKKRREGFLSELFDF